MKTDAQQTFVLPDPLSPRRTREVEFPGYDVEFARVVQKALLTSDSLLQQYWLAAAQIDTAWQWMEDLRAWRESLWDVVAYLACAGFAVPWDIELEPSPTKFIQTWRQLLLKVWSQVRPDQVAANFNSVETLH